MHAHTSDLPSSIVTPSSAASNGALHSATAARVLVVDDEELIANTIVQILQSNGFEAHAVYSGADAIAHARIHGFETVLSDVLMPKIDGVETAIAIREANPETRILLFSGQSATVEILERARARGHVFELLPKPIHPTVLLKHLRNEQI